MTTKSETEVLVVGAGPTGLMLACELSLAGVDTVVLERAAEPVKQVKGGGIQPRTAELLDARGLLEPLRARALAREPVGGHFALLPVPLDCTPWRTRHPYPLSVPQWAVEEVLEERARAQGARVVRGAAVTDVEPDGRGVTVRADERTLHAPHLVACDGAHSTVRRLLGLPFPGREGTYRALLADIRLATASELVPRTYGHISELTRHGGGYWAMLVPLGADRYRLTAGRAEPTDAPASDVSDGETAEPDATKPEGTARTADAGSAREAPVTDEEIATALRAVYGPETLLAEVENASRFGDATRQLTHYRHGPVLFAGDAAHIHPPLGGQGLNLGVQDAVNLGWKLAATVQGRAPQGLLASYESERHPAAAAVLHHTAAQRVLAVPEPAADVSALRDIVVELLSLPDANRHLAGLMSGLSLRYESLRYELPGAHPLVGERVPDVEVTTADGNRPLAALLAHGHAVLLDLAELVPEDLPLGASVDLVRAKAVDDLGADVLLVRPDGYVCWATNRPPEHGDPIPQHTGDRPSDAGELADELAEAVARCLTTR